MKKTILMMMAVMMLIAATGCRANNKKDNMPSATPEILPEETANNDITDENGVTDGTIPENGMDGNGMDGNDTIDGMQNGTQGDGMTNDGGTGTSPAPELVPSDGADQPDTAGNTK